MTKINRKVEYALLALKYISSQQTELTTAKMLAEQFHAPYETMAKVLQQLANHDYLKVEYGSQGGYRMTKNLTGLSLLDVMEIFQGKSNIAACLNEKKESCDVQSKCNIQGPIKKLNLQLQHFYKSVSINELLTL